MDLSGVEAILYAVLAFSVSLYPVGILLPCSNCCQAAGGDCCCVGTSLITLGPDASTPNGEVCFGVDEDGSCPGESLERPATAPEKSITIVVEWCDLSVTLECADEPVEDAQLTENYPLPLPPFFCETAEANVWVKTLRAGFSADMGFPDEVAPPFTDCDPVLSDGENDRGFGCYDQCNRLQVYFSVHIYETPTVGSPRRRSYYVTQRDGCDETPVIEKYIDGGAYCCPEEPEITITMAP